MEKEKWLYSYDECLWDGENKFDTKEEAIEAGKMNKVEPEQTFWVGKMIEIDEKYLLNNAKLFTVEDLNEELEEVCTDEDCYLEENSELEEELRGIIAEFIIEKFGKNINWIVDDVEEI